MPALFKSGAVDWPFYFTDGDHTSILSIYLFVNLVTTPSSLRDGYVA